MPADKPVMSCNALESLRRELVQARKRGVAWSKISESFPGVKIGTLKRVAFDSKYTPQRPDIRRALGLPITAPAPVCAKCGHVHVAKRCTSQASGKIARRRIAYKPLWLMTLAAYLAETKGR